MQAFDALPIDSERLRLRPLREPDADALFAVFSDPLVMRYWSTAPWTGPEPGRAMIAHDRSATTRDSLRLGLERRADGALLGTCTLFAIHDGSRRAEIGYALRSADWGRGYMHEALCALLHYGFDRLGLNRVEADVDPRNLASARTLERLGFRREGLLRERWIVDGEVSDSLLFGLLRREWAGGGRALAALPPSIGAGPR